MAVRNKKALAESMAAATRAIDAKREPNRSSAPRAEPVAAVPEAEPTAEQKARGTFALGPVVDKRPGGTNVTIGTAYRRRPTFEVLADQGVFSDAEVKALRHYRHHADIADRSPLRDSLNRQHGGTGTGPTVEILNAVRVRDDCERAAGSLADILRAVVVYDWSLSQWAMEHSGSVEECETRKGRRVCRLKPRGKALLLAKLDIQFAAKRIQAELEA